MSTIADLTDFELPPQGRYTAALVRYIDLGMQPSKFGSTRQSDPAFELLGIGEPSKPVLAFKRVFNLSPRSRNFREIVRALTGLHDIGGVDTHDLLDKWCEVDIEHVTNEEGNRLRKSRMQVPPQATGKRRSKASETLHRIRLRQPAC